MKTGLISMKGDLKVSITEDSADAVLTAPKSGEVEFIIELRFLDD